MILIINLKSNYLKLFIYQYFLVFKLANKLVILQ